MKENSDKKMLMEMMHKVGGMPLNENYPAGAEYDPAAPYNEPDNDENNKPDPDEYRDDDLSENDGNKELHSGGDKYKYYTVYLNSVVVNQLLLSKDGDLKAGKVDFEKIISNNDDYSINLDDNNVYVETIKNVTPEEAQQYVQRYLDYEKKEGQNQVMDRYNTSMETGSYN